MNNIYLVFDCKEKKKKKKKKKRKELDFQFGATYHLLL